MCAAASGSELFCIYMNNSHEDGEDAGHMLRGVKKDPHDPQYGDKTPCSRAFADSSQGRLPNRIFADCKLLSGSHKHHLTMWRRKERKAHEGQRALISFTHHTKAPPPGEEDPLHWPNDPGTCRCPFLKRAGGAELEEDANYKATVPIRKLLELSIF